MKRTFVATKIASLVLLESLTTGQDSVEQMTKQLVPRERAALSQATPK